jgi:Icc-related predicted phosphoesterase
VFSRRKRAYRIFFATDVHGSDRCFRKFLAAAKVYEANALILGGDVIGKAIVPLEREGSRYRYRFQGTTAECSQEELAEIRERINFNGLYPWEASPEEARRLHEDPDFGPSVFSQIMVDQIESWCELAAERLPDSVPCIITPGNDDPFVIDDVLRAASRVDCPERELFPVGPVVLASLGNTNSTPWETDREYGEEELGEQIAALLDPAEEPNRVVLNFHCPPYGSGLDTAIELDEDFKPVIKNGTPVEIPVGSTAVRDAIHRYRPAAALHGHIHEAAGARKLNGTICINPGSEYASGLLKGAILDLRADGSYHDHLLTTG